MTLNCLFICVFIAGVLVLIVFSRWIYRCPLAGEMMGAWERNSAEYHRGAISFEELIERSDRLIECRERLRK